MKFVFASFLMIISIFQSKRDSHTTLRSDFMGGKASKWWFLENFTQTLLLPLLVTSIREFHEVATAASELSKNFSVASHKMKFVFASFLMIISIPQSKRDGRTTVRSDSMGRKASKWWFLDSHTQSLVLPSWWPQEESFTKARQRL